MNLIRVINKNRMTLNNLFKITLCFPLCINSFLSCSGNSIPKIDPTKIDVGGYVADRDEFLNDPVKHADFGEWKLLNHINYYYAEKYEGEITPSYYVMFVNIAAFETEQSGITVGPDDDSRFTENGGRTWTIAKGGEVYCRFGIDIVNNDVAWNNGNGGLKYTLNGGRSWNTVSKIQCLPHISFCDEETGWIASSFFMYSTKDRGGTFQMINLPSDNLSIAAISLRSSDEGYLLDTKGNLYATDDFGKTWRSFSIGLEKDELLFSSNHIRAAVRFTDSRNGKIVFTKYDTSVWTMTTSDGGATWRKSEITGVRDRSRFFQVYLSRNTELLTLTSNFEDRNESFILKYRD
ncbi:MAG: hypothetical protein JW982_00705 [Spirochaetes bacterium]|nr:hypothetical protein [Spirochaetota bacterium]